MQNLLTTGVIVLALAGALLACNADPSYPPAEAAGGAGGSSGSGGASASSTGGGAVGGEAGAPGSGAASSGGGSSVDATGGAGGSASSNTATSNATSSGGTTSAGGSATSATSTASDSGGASSSGGTTSMQSSGGTSSTTGGTSASSTTADPSTTTGGDSTTGSGGTTTGVSSTTGTTGGTGGVLLFEDFEDGNYDGWQVGTGSYELDIVASPAADGSNSSLSMSGESDFHQGLSYLFDNVQPSYISYWIYPTHVDGAHGYFVLSAPGGTEIENQVVFVYLAGGEIIVASSDFFEPLATTSFTINQWHHIEMSFDWTADTIDFSLNGAAWASDIPFRATEFGYNVDAVAQLDIFHISADSLCYWDELLVQ